MPINKGLGGFCFLKSVKDEIINIITKKHKKRKTFIVNLSKIYFFL